MFSCIKPGTAKLFILALNENNFQFTIDAKSPVSLSDSVILPVTNIKSVESLDLTPLEQPLSQNIVFSKNVPLVASFRVMQSFGLDDKGNIYYSQIGTASGFIQGRTKAHELYIVHGKPNAVVGKDFMTLKYFGHGGQISVEDDGQDVYIWVSSNATKYPSGEYWDARSVSRIKYESGKIYENGYGGDTYFLNNGIFRVEAAVNTENNSICINASKNGVRYFYTYRLSDVVALPLTNFTFSVKNGGEENGTSECMVTRKMKGHDLSELTPLGFFSIPVGSNKEADPNSLHFQGYEIDAGNHIYFFEGNGNDYNTSGRPSLSYITVYDIHGNIVHKRTKVEAIASGDLLEKEGLTNSSGYMEAEGITIKGNQLYLGFASHQEEEDYRRANILKYHCQRK